MNKISSIEIIKKASNLFINNLFFIISIILLLITCSIVFSSIQEAMLESNPIQWFLFSIASQLFTMGLSLGVSYIFIRIIQKKEATLLQIFEKFNLVIPYFLASLIFAISLLLSMVPGILLLFSSIDINNIIDYDFISLLQYNPEQINFDSISLNITGKIGLLCIMIGFLYTYLRLQFYQYGIIYKNLSPIQAIIESATITKNNLNDLSILLFLIIIINLLGAFLVVGLLFTLPVSMIALIITYFSLLKQTPRNE